MSTRLLAFAAVLAIATPAAAQDVKVDFDRNYDFSKMKTFMSEVSTKWGNDLGERRVKAAVDSALMAKGWRMVSNIDSAVAAVLIHGATGEKQSSSTFYSGGSYGGWGWRGGWGAPMTATTQTYEYKVGTLVVDIFDIATKQAVFRGTADAELSDKPEKNQKKLAKAMEKMWKNFPPGSQPQKK